MEKIVPKNKEDRKEGCSRLVHDMDKKRWGGGGGGGGGGGRVKGDFDNIFYAL